MQGTNIKLLKELFNLKITLFKKIYLIERSNIVTARLR
jgi:hypothetical protein